MANSEAGVNRRLLYEFEQDDQNVWNKRKRNYIKIASYKVNGLRNPVKSSTILTKLKTVVVVLISNKINHLAEMGDT